MLENRADHPVLIVAPLGQDAPTMAAALGAEGVQTQVCADLAECAKRINDDTSALLLTEEALELQLLRPLTEALKAQPRWSELPIVVLTSSAHRHARLLDLMAMTSGSLTVLERPMQASTLFSTMQVALRSRRRQYEVRDLLEEQQRNVRELEQAIETKARLAAIVESSADAIIGKDLNGVINSWNKGAQGLFGYTADEVLGRPVTLLIPADHANDEQEILERIRRGETIDPYETVRRRKDGTLLDVSLTISPIRNADGRVIGASKVARDITAQKLADQALRESEAAARRLLELHQTTLAHMGEGMYTLDREGRVTYVNQEAERLLGWTAAELLGRNMHETVHCLKPDGSPYPIEDCAALRVLREGEVLKGRDDAFIRKDGTFLPVSYSSSPLRDEMDEITGLVVVFQDTTERERAKEHQKLLLSELSHRVKNVLATVQAIAAETGERAHSLEEFQKAFEGRLRALARTHGLLVKEGWRPTSLHSLFAELGRTLMPNPSRCQAAGSDTFLSPSQAVTLSMMFYELMTNALKYGAWSSRNGTVVLRTAILHDPDSARARLEWVESGGPAAMPPTRSGYGTRMLQDVAAYELEGRTDIEYASTGLRCTIEFPVSSQAPARPSRDPLAAAAAG